MEIKTVIVEDEKHSRETLKNLIEEFCQGIEIVGMANNVTSAIQLINSTKPDLVFLDIELQSGTGFDILQQLSPLHFEVIFTTAFEQYAIKAVKMSSLDYLLKPVDLEELQQAVSKAKKAKNRANYKQQLELLIENLKHRKTSPTKICLTTNDGVEFIATDDILYCKAEGSYTNFRLTTGNNVLVSKHLKEYESLLSDQSFMRVHNSYLINLHEVKKYVKSDGGYIMMNNNDTISISRNKKDIFLEAMKKFTTL